MYTEFFYSLTNNILYYFKASNRCFIKYNDFESTLKESKEQFNNKSKIDLTVSLFQIEL